MKDAEDLAKFLDEQGASDLAEDQRRIAAEMQKRGYPERMSAVAVEVEESVTLSPEEQAVFSLGLVRTIVEAVRKHQESGKEDVSLSDIMPNLNSEIGVTLPNGFPLKYLLIPSRTTAPIPRKDEILAEASVLPDNIKEGFNRIIYRLTKVDVQTAGDVRGSTVEQLTNLRLVGPERANLIKTFVNPPIAQGL